MLGQASAGWGNLPPESCALCLNCVWLPPWTNPWPWGAGAIRGKPGHRIFHVQGQSRRIALVTTLFGPPRFGGAAADRERLAAGPPLVRGAMAMQPHAEACLRLAPGQEATECCSGRIQLCPESLLLPP